MEHPYYLPLTAEDTPRLEGRGYHLEVVAGDYQNIKGPAKTFSPMILLRGKIETKNSMELSLPAHYNSLLYLLDGELKVNGRSAKRKDLVWFANDGEIVEIKAKADTRFMVLSGEPIGEKVTSYGPFVMNTQTEIMEALRDAQMGKMGVLIESFD